MNSSAEPSEDFNWSAVEDPAGVLREEFAALGVPLDAVQAAAVLGWLAGRERSASGLEATLTERVLGWMASSRDAGFVPGGRGAARPREAPAEILRRRFGLRASVACRVLVPHMRQSLSYRRIGQLYGVGKSEVFRLVADFREQVGAPGSGSP